MGDTGSLAIGAGLACLAALTATPLLLPDHRRPVRVRDDVGDPPGRQLPAHRQADLPHGAGAPPLRAGRLAGDDGHHPLLDPRRRSAPASALGIFYADFVGDASLARGVDGRMTSARIGGDRPPGGAGHGGPPGAGPRRTPSTSAYLLLFGVLAMLNLIGLVMVLSASSVVGAAPRGQLVVLLLPPARRRRSAASCCSSSPSASTTGAGGGSPCSATSPSSALLVAVLVPGVGVNVNGSSRWVDLGLLQLQPSEFAKLATLLVVADLVARRQAWVGDPPARCCCPALRVVRRRRRAAHGSSPTSARPSCSAPSSFAVLFAAGVPGRHARPAAALVGAVRRRRRPRSCTPLPAGPVLRLPRPVGRPGVAPATRTSSRRCRSARAGWLGVGLGEGTPEVGLPARRPTPTSSSPSSARSSACSARCFVVVLFGLLGFLGIRAARSGARHLRPAARHRHHHVVLRAGAS